MKKKFISSIALALTVIMLTGIMPLVGASVTLEVYNPLGIIVPVENQPLAPRLPTLEGANIALVFYAQPQNPHTVRAIGEMMENEFDITAQMKNIGSPIGAKPLAHYDALADFDAVVLGVADCANSAWWAAYHAMMIERRGTPVVVLTHSLFTRTLEVGAIDNGFTGVRSAVIDARTYSAGFQRMTAVGNTDFLRANAEFQVTFNQAVAALTDALTVEEINPPVITAQMLAGWTTGDPTATRLSVQGSTEMQASRNFNRMAADLGFGDGLPLIMPLPCLVEEMLAATTRDANEVLGKIMPRGGIITVEKAAVNAVMAGARPSFFPVVLAALEAYASSWEDGNLLYHSLTSSDNYSMMLLVSGPIVEELGITGQWGYLGSGNEANNAIGRAVRLAIRNIGQNRTGETDGTARIGRQNDHAMTVFGEESALLPQGWERFHELKGFDRNQSTITLLSYSAVRMYTSTGDGVNARWTPQATRDSIRGTFAAGAQNVTIATIPRAVAETMRSEMGLTNKQALIENLLTDGAVNANLSSPYMIWPIVVGDPDNTHTWRANSPFFGAQAFQTRLIGGATQTQAGRDAITPSAPQNFTVTRSADGTEATLSWTAPLNNGGSAITGYQVSFTGGSAAGANNPGGVIPSVSATIGNPAVAAGSSIAQTPTPFATNEHPNTASWVDVPAGQMTFTFTNLDPATPNEFFNVRAISSVVNAFEVTGFGAAMTASTDASGRGSWAIDPDEIIR